MINSIKYVIIHKNDKTNHDQELHFNPGEYHTKYDKFLNHTIKNIY